jgi:hypothetical protein
MYLRRISAYFEKKLAEFEHAKATRLKMLDASQSKHGISYYNQLRSIGPPSELTLLLCHSMGDSE